MSICCSVTASSPMNGRRVPKAREWSSTATVARSATSAATTSARRSGSAAFTLKKSAFRPSPAISARTSAARAPPRSRRRPAPPGRLPRAPPAPPRPARDPPSGPGGRRRCRSRRRRAHAHIPPRIRWIRPGPPPTAVWRSVHSPPCAPLVGWGNLPSRVGREQPQRSRSDEAVAPARAAADIPARDRRAPPAATGRPHPPPTDPALKRPSLSLQIAVGLLVGLGFGLLAAGTGSRGLLRAATGVEPVGTLWVNLIRMVVIPLVMGAVIGGVAGFGDPKRVGRLGVRAILFFLVTGAAGIAMGLVLARVALPLAPPSQEAVAALRDAAPAGSADLGQSVRRLPGFTRFLTDLVPANPAKAAADGALLPIIVFSVLLGLAAAHLDDRHRQVITGLADAVVAAMVRLVGWFMVVAPLGVACLAAPVAARLGWGMLASFGMFIGVVVVGCLLFTAVVYAPIVRFAARLPLGRFARAVAPAWAVGFSTTSSMAALPA